MCRKCVSRFNRGEPGKGRKRTYLFQLWLSLRHGDQEGRFNAEDWGSCDFRSWEFWDAVEMFGEEALVRRDVLHFTSKSKFITIKLNSDTIP